MKDVIRPDLLNLRAVAERLYGVLFHDWGRVWRVRLALCLIVALVVCAGFTFWAFSGHSPMNADAGAVIWLLNVDLVILLALAVLLGRRVVSLWSGRKRGLAGSHLHVRLVFTFSLLAAIPAIAMTIFSAFFFQYGVQAWFSQRVESAIDHSSAVAGAYLEEHKQSIAADAQLMASDLERWLLDRTHENSLNFEAFVRRQSFLYDLPDAVIFDTEGKVFARAGNSDMLEEQSIPTKALKTADEDQIVLLTEDGEELVRALVKIRSFDNRFLYVGRLLDPQVLSYLQATQDATDDYVQLRSRSGALQISVTLLFVVIGLLLVMLAIWMGLVLSRQLIEPISMLLGATQRVRSGDYSSHVRSSGKFEEFDQLADGFNKMTDYIRAQQEEVLSVNRALDERRRFSETVLRGVSSGVLGLDSQGVIHLANAAAHKLLVSGDVQQLTGHQISDILPEAAELLAQAEENPQKLLKREIQVELSSGAARYYLVRVALEHLSDGEYGAILTIEDLTEMHKAQRQAAWADVARRIAHEIKNPLTPIQLAAERLKRKYLAQIDEGRDVFEQCTDTIVHHVQDIGAMVNAFAEFARMPEPDMKPEALCSLMEDTILFHRQAYPQVEFACENHTGGDVMLSCDKGQMRQVFQNLLKNAIEAMDEKAASAPRVVIDVYDISGFKADYEADLAIIVQDNGPGYPDGHHLDQLLEPYVSVKEGGTGLGLAIVKKIIDDHGGVFMLDIPQNLASQLGWVHLGGATSMMLFKRYDSAPRKESE